MSDSELSWITPVGAEVEIIPPDAGDGESFYFEVSRHGETWDGRSATLAEAREDAEDMAARLVELQGWAANHPTRRTNSSGG